MKNRKYLILLLVLVIALSSFLLINKNRTTKKRVLKELNYDVTYKQAFPDENLRKSIILCIMRNKCNNYDESIYNYDQYYNTMHNWPQTSSYVNEYYQTIDYLTKFGPTIYESDINNKSNEKIRKEDLEQIKILLSYDFTRPVTTLQGVEYLTNLKAVALEQVQTEEVDFSNNLLLEKILINPKSDNFADVGNLKSIILGQKDSLSELAITLTKESTDLDLSNFNNLKNVVIRNSHIKNIKLPNFIKRVNLSENNISNIDLSNKTGLIDLNLVYNPIEELNTQDAVNLKTLFMNNGKLKEINLSNNNSLENLVIYSSNLKNITLPNPSKIKTLRLSDNVLENIDLSNQTYLSSLHIENNKLRELDLMKCTP